MSSKDKMIGTLIILVGIVFLGLGVWGLVGNINPNNVEDQTGINVYSENNNEVDIYSENM